MKTKNEKTMKEVKESCIMIKLNVKNSSDKHNEIVKILNDLVIYEDKE